MTTFEINKGDSLPVFSVTLQFANGSAINLTNGSVFLHLGSLSNYEPFFSGAANITNATAGKAEYRWSGNGADTNMTGTFWAEFKTTWTGSQLTLPSNHSLQLKVFEDYE